MKTLLTALVTAVIFVVLLRSDLTPWRIVKKTDLDQLSRPRVVERRVAVPIAASVDHAGDWIRDPNYRSALEKRRLSGARRTQLIEI